jgi:hypothetical protein
MAAFLGLGFVPSSGVRQPRIQYRIDDPSMEDLEEFRRVFGSRGHGKMAKIYVEALLIGARIMLHREADGVTAGRSKPNAPSKPATTSASVNSPATVPDSTSVTTSGTSSVSPEAEAASPEAHLGAAVLTTVAENGEPVVKRSSKAASAQFDQFGG